MCSRGHRVRKPTVVGEETTWTPPQECSHTAALPSGNAGSVTNPPPHRGAVWAAGWDTHVCAGQELPHDVGVVHLPAPAQPVLFVVQFLIFFYLDFRRLSTLAFSFLETSFI